MDSPPLLTFDLDGVLCRPPFGINPGTGTNKSRETPGTPGLLWRTEAWRYRCRRPMPGAIDGFTALAKEFRCVVVTARGKPAEAVTREWLRHYLGATPELHLRPDWTETSAQYKARKMGELHPLAHFEDDPFTAKWVSELIPHVFLVEWPRNRALMGSNIHRIERLVDASGILNDVRSG